MTLQAVKVVDIVDTSSLQEQPQFHKRQFVTYMKRYIKLLTPISRSCSRRTIQSLLSKLSELQFFVGESMRDYGTVAFAYYKEGATDPTFL